MRNITIIVGMLAYFALLAVVTACGCWPAVAVLLAVAGLIETVSHNMQSI